MYIYLTMLSKHMLGLCFQLLWRYLLEGQEQYLGEQTVARLIFGGIEYTKVQI
jgi:hypothetical protein